MPSNIPGHLKGLSEEQVKASREQFGYNRIDPGRKNTAWEILLDVLKEPMLILLLIISLIYVIVGLHQEAIFMFAATVAVSCISFYQDNRSKKALKELEKLNEPLSTVIRNYKITKIPTRDIAVGDLCITEEGKMINGRCKNLGERRNF